MDKEEAKRIVEALLFVSDKPVSIDTLKDVLKDIELYEREDGHVDLWRRTIQKFYNRVIGNRDYTLFEVVRYGIRLPPILSSFGDVHNASLSSWKALKPTKAIRFLGEDEDVRTMKI